MEIAVNLALLLLGTTGALAAFGGETWVKGSGPLLTRVTPRGWLSLVCLFATLGLGIQKEVLGARSSAAAAERQAILETKLRNTSEDLNKARKVLAAVEPNILRAIVVATQGIRRESDFSTPHLNGQESMRLVSGRHGGALLLYGGDILDYHVFCTGAVGRSSRFGDGTSLSLRVGNTTYPLSPQGRQMIIGPIGLPMEATLVNPEQTKRCDLKILVDSADRHRESEQLEPLIRMIEDAKAAALAPVER
jgi:hypothetical protein